MKNRLYRRRLTFILGGGERLYTRVESQFWKDEKMRDLSEGDRYLMLYLLTSPHRNIAGLYYLPLSYACFDLGWDEKRLRQGLEELSAKQRIKYDYQAHVVLIFNYVKYNPLENPNQVKSAIAKVEELPKTPLLQDFLAVIQGLNKPLYEPLLKRFAKPGTGTGTESFPLKSPPWGGAAFRGRRKQERNRRQKRKQRRFRRHVLLQSSLRRPMEKALTPDLKTGRERSTPA